MESLLDGIVKGSLLAAVFDVGFSWLRFIEDIIDERFIDHMLCVYTYLRASTGL